MHSLSGKWRNLVRELANWISGVAQGIGRRNWLACNHDLMDNSSQNRGVMSVLSAVLPGSTIAGYSVDQAPDLSAADERDRLSPSAIKAFVNISEKWKLNEVQARGLLGGIASSTFHAWKTKPDGKKLDQDTLMRISLVIGIYRALNTYFGQPWADQWVLLANRGSMFAGQAPIDHMLRYGQPGMLQVRQLLDSWRGGR
jgi:Protein of unknown function (DUF2384)